MAQDKGKNAITISAALPTLMVLTPTKGIDFYAAQLGLSRDAAQEGLRELAIR